MRPGWFKFPSLKLFYLVFCTNGHKNRIKFRNLYPFQGVICSVLKFAALDRQMEGTVWLIFVG